MTIRRVGRRAGQLRIDHVGDGARNVGEKAIGGEDSSWRKMTTTDARKPNGLRRTLRHPSCRPRPLTPGASSADNQRRSASRKTIAGRRETESTRRRPFTRQWSARARQMADRMAPSSPAPATGDLVEPT